LDTDGDAVADIAYRVRFSPPQDGAQAATVRRAEGADAARMGDGGATIIAVAPVSFGQEARGATSGGYRFCAGLRSDPFFADVSGALNGLQFTGSDFFADADVFGIVLGVPNRALGPRPGIGLWCRALIPRPTPRPPGPAPAGSRWIAQAVP